jgi:hypothetical protein
MEWLEGEDLGQRLTASPLPLGQSLDVARPLANIVMEDPGSQNRAN